MPDQATEFLLKYLEIKNRPPKAFIIEDEYGDVYGINRILLEAGCRTVTAFDGQQARQALAMERDHGLPIDFIITDLKMPQCFGVDILHDIQRIMGVSIPVIVMTAYVDMPELKEAMNQGIVFGVCEKPFTMDKLYQILAKHRIPAPLVNAVTKGSL